MDYENTDAEIPNGFGTVTQFTDKKDGILKTMLVESRQLNKDGSISLPPNSAKQAFFLSDTWISRINEKLDSSSAAKEGILNAQFTGILIKCVAYVDDGELKMVPVNIPN
jgi:hypothetical protein